MRWCSCTVPESGPLTRLGCGTRNLIAEGELGVSPLMMTASRGRSSVGTYEQTDSLSSAKSGSDPFVWVLALGDLPQPVTSA